MKKKLLTVLLSLVLLVTFCAFGMMLTGCGDKEPAGGTIEIRLSGGTFKDGKMIKKFKPGISVTIVAQEKLGKDGNPDKFVKWTDQDGNVLSTNSTYSVTVPDDEKGMTIYGEWEWYGKAATNPVADDRLIGFIEDNGGEGSMDKAVKAAIEKKFKDDTGYSIDLKIEAGTTGTLSTKVSGELAAGNRIDFMTNHWGTDSPIDGYLKGEMTQVVDEILLNAPTFREIYYASDPYKDAYYTGVYEGELKGISSIDVHSKWGMLMNGTMLDSLYTLAKTAADNNDAKWLAMYDEAFPAEEFDRTQELSSYFDVANDNYKNMTISQFKSVLMLSKNLIKTIVRPLNASGWSVDYLISPVFEGTSYGGYEYDEANNRIIPSYATEGYKNVLAFERWMQDEKLWYENPNSSDGNDFYAQKNIVMVAWPDAPSLVKQIRQLESAVGDKGIVLAPLATDEGVVNGNASQATAFSGFVVFKNSPQKDLIARYLEWQYTKDENGNYSNYELVTYGVEGEQWVKGQLADGTVTWDYPADKKAQFMTTEPYSGRFGLAGNAYIADYVWADYNETEMAYWKEIRNFKTWSGVPVEWNEGIIYGGTNPSILAGYNMPTIDSKKTDLVKVNKSLGDQYQEIRGLAWSAKALPAGKTIESMHDEMVAKFNTDYKPLIDWLTENFEAFDEIRSTQKRVGEE